MGRTPHKHHILHGKIKSKFIELPYNGNVSGSLFGAHLSNILTVQQNLAGINGVDPVDGFQQGGFSAAVWPDDAYTLPLAYMEADAVYDLGFAQRHMDIFYSKLQLIYLQSRNLFSAAYIGTPAHQAQQ